MNDRVRDQLCLIVTRYGAGILQDPRLWGVKNLSAGNWVVTKPDGAMSDVAPGRSVSLSAGARINFGKVESVVAA